MRVLFITPYVPSQIRVRPYQLLRGLAERGHAVTLLCPAGSNDADALAALRPYCERIVSAPLSRAAVLANCLRALPSALPFQAAYCRTPALLELVRRTAAAGGYDVIHVEHLRGAELGLAAMVADAPPMVFDAVDCISLLFERALRRSPSLAARAMALLDLQRTRRYEASYGAHFPTTLVTSPEDRWALETLRDGGGGARTGAITVLANGVDLAYFAPQDRPRASATLVFTGKMSYHANQAAALFLAQQIMPLVWRERPDVRLQLVGAGPPPSLLALAADTRIEVTGWVADLRPYLAQATLAVCALRYGVGIQNKVLEAMAMGAPLVASRQAAVALDALDGHELILAERPDEFARAILALLDDPARRAALGTRGRQYVERQHDWARAIATLEDAYAAALHVQRGR
ncbi:MAG: glycosyltransferase [Chloroflexales bacterium]|nr:glycosyltransferase [Chloroflexales bacterium]